MKLKRAWIVYMHKNKINGKVYIGITCRSDNPNKRWCNGKHYESNKYFTAAIKKYGWNNFEHIILFEGITSEEKATKLETLTIEKYNALDRRYGYNALPGGKGYYSGYKMSKEHKKHMMEAIEKFKNSENYEEYLLFRSEFSKKYWKENREELLRKSKETRKKNHEMLLNKPICKISISKSQYWGIGNPFIAQIFPSIKSLDEIENKEKILKTTKRIKKKIMKGEKDIFKDKENRWCFVEDAIKIFPDFKPIVKYNIYSEEVSKIYIGINNINANRREKVKEFLKTREIVNKKYFWFSFEDYLSYIVST